MPKGPSPRSILKTPLNIADQISLLRSRDLIIINSQEAMDFLSENNYYRFNYYLHHFLDTTNKFLPGTTFSRIQEIYNKDSILRNHILSVLEPIEIRLRASIAYVLATAYGSDAFYNKSNFAREDKYNELVNQFAKEVSNNRNNPAVRHHQVKYSGYFPIWVIVELLTFGKNSNLFRNLHPADQKNISFAFFNTNEYYFRNWIHSLGDMRNICAHYGHLFKRSFSTNVKFGYYKGQLRNYENTLFGVIFCIKQLSKIDYWNSFYANINTDIGKTSLITDYGFPSDFEKFLT